MAVKKAANKSAVKKAPVKKVVAKKAPVKKVAVKKAAVKKVAAKRVAAKRVAKSAPVKNAAATPASIKSGVTKKVVAKKAVEKKVAAKKAPTKKAVAKKAVVKKVAKTAAAPLVIPAILPAPVVFISSETPLAPVAYSAKPTPTVVTSVTPKAPVPAQKSSSRVVLWVIIGVVAIAALVVARDHKPGRNNSDRPSTAVMTPIPSATPTDTSSPTAMVPATPTPSSASTGASTGATSSDPAPIGIVAHYNSTGATIFWSPGAGATGLTTYKVDAANNGGPFKLIATIPATQLSLDVTERDTVGWTSFKISAVYSDGKTVAGKIFGLPGQYS